MLTLGQFQDLGKTWVRLLAPDNVRTFDVDGSRPWLETVSGPELQLASEPLLDTMYGAELGVESGP